MEYGKIAIHSQSTKVFILRHVHRTAVRYASASYAEFDSGMPGRTIACDASSGTSELLSNRHKGAPLYHDPLQLPNPEDDPIYESLDTRRCLVAMKAIVEGTLYSSIVLIALLFVLQLRTKLDAINTRIVQYGHLRDINRELVVNFSFTTCAIIRVSLLKTSVREYNGVIICLLRMQLRVRR